MLQKPAEKISSSVKFVKNDVWRMHLDDQSRSKSFFIRLLRVILLTTRGFKEDKCSLNASALTLYSLLSIVPVMAMAFGISKGFGTEKLLEKILLEKFPGQEEVITQVITFAHSLLEETKGGMLTGIGIALLFWIVIKLLGNIERSFNDIWGIKKPRQIFQKLTDYISVVIVCPILLIISSSATVFITTQVTSITERFELLGMFRPVIFFLIKLMPYGLISGLFAFIYLFMPNIRVKLKAAIISGLIAGAAYQLAQWGYINFQVGVAQYNAIYGSFAALPLFLIWLQISWLIVLFGAEISFTIQNVDTYEYEPDCLNASNSFKQLLSLQVSYLIIKTFSAREHPLSVTIIAKNIGAPIQLVNRIIYDLIGSNIISEINSDNDDSSKEIAYLPACDINLLTPKYVIDALNNQGVDTIPIKETKELKILTETLKTFSNITQESSANKLLKDL